MKFYRVKAHNPGPAAELLCRKFSNQLHGMRMVNDITPSSYEMDVCYSAKRWPDLMQSLDCLLLSKRVVTAFQEKGLRGVDFYSQKLRNIDSKVLQKLPDPHYHWACALTGVPAVPHDWDRSDAISGTTFDPASIDLSNTWPLNIDPSTGFYDLSKGSNKRFWKFDFSQWQGADLFYISTVHTRYRYCTQRFKDLVESHKFTNFRFTGALNPEGDWFFA